MKKFIMAMLLCFFVSGAYAGDYYTVGVDWYKKGDIVKACHNFEVAVRQNPKNVNARYYLAQTYIMQKRNEDAREQYMRIILLAPQSDAARLSQKGLSLIQQSCSQTTIAAATSSTPVALSGDLSQYKDNYTEYFLTSPDALIRWATFPIKVYIPNGQQKSIVQNAFNQWTSATNGLIKFSYVNSLNNAEIIINFQGKLENSSTEESYISGLSKPYYQNGSIVKSDMQLLTVDPATGERIADSSLYYTALHEMGHSLGIKGHSPNNNDVMAASVSDTNKKLSKRDVNTITLLYKMTKEDLANSKKSGTDVVLQQAIDYAKSAPDKAISWSNLGDVYRGKKMYKEAVKNYQKAVSIEPDKPDFYSLLGTAYRQMGDSENAYSNLKKACDLDKNNDFYLYQFADFCLSKGHKETGMRYLDSYIKANPKKIFDEKIQRLMKDYGKN